MIDLKGHPTFVEHQVQDFIQNQLQQVKSKLYKLYCENCTLYIVNIMGDPNRVA